MNLRVCAVIAAVGLVAGCGGAIEGTPISVDEASATGESSNESTLRLSLEPTCAEQEEVVAQVLQHVELSNDTSYPSGGTSCVWSTEAQSVVTVIAYPSAMAPETIASMGGAQTAVEDQRISDRNSVMLVTAVGLSVQTPTHAITVSTMGESQDTAIDVALALMDAWAPPPGEASAPTPPKREATLPVQPSCEQIGEVVNGIVPLPGSPIEIPSPSSETLCRWLFEDSTGISVGVAVTNQMPGVIEKMRESDSNVNGTRVDDPRLNELDAVAFEGPLALVVSTTKHNTIVVYDKNPQQQLDVAITVVEALAS